MQHWADDLRLKLTVCHFPPGTSKWTRIEHGVFGFITQNWRGRPLLSRRTIVSLFSRTKTRTGLAVKTAIDAGRQDTAIDVGNDELGRMKLTQETLMGTGTAHSATDDGLRQRRWAGNVILAGSWRLPATPSPV